VVLAMALLATLLPLPRSATPTASAATCPCSVWAATVTPGTPSDSDSAAVELGMKFRADSDGYITGVRFYKGSGNTGTHIGHLWSSTGTQLASATFSGESASGWQQVLFAAPVQVNANQTYVVSYYAPRGHYAADSGFFASTAVDNAPLHALRDGTDGSNGVYRYGTGGGFPSNSYQSTNYWVDVVYNTSVNDTTPPTVTSSNPAAQATDVPASTNVTATFSEPVQPTSVNIAVTGPGSTSVSGTTSYDGPSRTATFTPSSALALSTTFTVTVSGAKDPSNNTMQPFSWTFTTAATASGCPCSIWSSSDAPTIASANDASAVELGVRFRSSTNGYISGIRYYKGSSNTGTHLGTLWSNSGTQLAQVTFSGETASGWQQAIFASPVAVQAGTTYVASYHTNTGFYAATNGGFASSGVSRGPLTALANGVDGANGVYRYGGGGFPTDTYQSTNYWVDVVFDTTANDTTPPAIAARAPAPDSTGVPTTIAPTVTFNEPVVSSSITMTLSKGGTTVAATKSYDSATRTATLTPNSALVNSAAYSVSVSGATDNAGNAMPSAVTWSFTTAAPPPPPPDQGPGGPVLLVKNSSSTTAQFAPYTAEILRAEGYDEFATADLASVTRSTLDQYDVVILGATPLTSVQVTLFSDWVSAGGNLIAFKPDKQLAGLLGLTAVTTTPTTLANGYLKAATGAAPGAGITDQTIQFHGTADRYLTATATAVATLYSNATTATSNPAVSLVSVGSSGGQAAAFTYDLPQSIIQMRQGNPAWDGLERDTQAPIRSDDLYFGGTSTDWVNLSKVAIPQADEQQRLLTNLVTHMNLDRKPLPKLWYFPRSAKAVVVATGDDHANGGTAGRFDQYAANSPAGCSVDNWECLRFSSYVFTNTALTSAQANAYNANGFEVGLHPQNGCTDYTTSSLPNDYSSQLSDWRQKYGGLPSPVTNRFHCIVYSDWLSQPTVEGSNGMRLDTNYYYWPGSWINDRPGFMTGSGMPMRFASKTGSMLDVYQAATQMTDESGQSYPLTPNTLLDNALGTLGYYGAFTANMHTDSPTIFQNDQLLASATARGVPVVSSRQMLTWLDGRNGSSFTGIGWSGNTLTFGVTVGAGANGLTGMVPTVGPGGVTLSGLSRGGTDVSFSKTTIKGVEYAMFLAQPGSYTATYGSAGSAQAAIAAAVPATTDTSATLNVQSTTTLTSTEVNYGTSPSNLTEKKVDATQGGKHSVAIDGLEPGTTYYYKVTAETPTGATTSSSTQEFTTAGADGIAPSISKVESAPLPDGTSAISWQTKEPADGSIMIGRRADDLSGEHAQGTTGLDHSVTATGLRRAATYYYRVKSVDAAGNESVWPALSSPPATFVSSAAGVADRSATQFRMHKSASGAYVQQDGYGEIALSPESGEEFGTASLPSEWQDGQESDGGTTAVSRGELDLDGRWARTRQTFSPGRSLTFKATFAGPADQWAGLASGSASEPFAMFGLRNGVLYAATNTTKLQTLALPKNLVGSPHVYRISWTDSGVTFFVDGKQVWSQAMSMSSARPAARDAAADGAPLGIDWVRFGKYTDAGTYVSRVLDAQQMVTWDRAAYRADVPSGTGLRVSVRLGSTPTPDATWSSWSTLSGSGARIEGDSRYLQYRVTLSTNVPAATPLLRDIGFTYSGPPPAAPGEVER
jgi:hypothetical protein